MKTTINESLLCDLKTILGCLDEESELAESQRATIAIVEQLKNQTYAIYSECFSSATWKDECECLGVPHESERVDVRFIVESLEIDTHSVAKHFSITPESVWGHRGHIYCVTKGESHDLLVAHVEGSKIVYDVNPIFLIGETFTLPYDEYEDDGSYKTITETYTVTGYDLSGSHAEGIVYLGDGGSAWIMENALIEQKAKFKVGDTFYYAPGEVTTHAITKIDFSKQEFDEVVYWAENDSMYISESELMKQKEERAQARTFFSITDVHGRLAVCGRFNASNDDMRNLAKEPFAPMPESFPSCYVGDGTIEVEAIGSHYKGLDAENAVFLARSAFCVQAVPVGKLAVNFLVDENILNDVISKKIQLTQELEFVISVAA